jgi:hypothetical protein
MWTDIDPAYNDVYEVGYNEGRTGNVTPDDNPYRQHDDAGFRFYWGEGLFDGYKEYLNDTRSSTVLS